MAITIATTIELELALSIVIATIELAVTPKAITSSPGGEQPPQARPGAAELDEHGRGAGVISR